LLEEQIPVIINALDELAIEKRNELGKLLNMKTFLILVSNNPIVEIIVRGYLGRLNSIRCY